MPIRLRAVVRRIAVESQMLLVILACTHPDAVAGIDGRVDFLAARRGKSEATFGGSLRFAAPPGEEQLLELARLGIVFDDRHSRTVYPAEIPFASLDSLARRHDIEHLECAWRPRPRFPLAGSGPAVEADLTWSLPSPLGGTLSGKGVVVCDLDSGVEVRHAAFLELSGERFDWLDVNADGQLGPGDAVDLDRDGHPGADESLAHREAIGTARYGNSLGLYDADLDYLHNDRDGDAHWDQGPPLYGEDDPCFGERLFLADDANGNRRLDPGEELLALGGSRIRAVMDFDRSVHRRGVDLLSSDGDYYRHGTAMNGILAGGWPGRHLITGIAPGAGLIVAAPSWIDDPAGTMHPLESILAWAVDEGAQVVLLEFGNWLGEFLDGSSNLEMMMSEYAAEGVIFVSAAGNLASGNMHARFTSSARQEIQAQPDASLVWASFLWTAPRSLQLRVIPPGGHGGLVRADGSIVVIDGFEVFSSLSVSPRGTRRLDLHLSREGGTLPVAGTWAFEFRGEETEVHGYFSDDISSWVSASRWTHGLDANYTVTWPATADSSINVAAYATGRESDGVMRWSSRGPRIDGRPLIDLAAPGYYVTSADATNSSGYVSVSGTSASAPHVAGAAALLKELDPGLDHGRCRYYLRAGAQSQAGSQGIHDAGAGYLRIRRAAAFLLEDLSSQGAVGGIEMVVTPNPAVAMSRFRFLPLSSDVAEVRVFDVAGREVWATQDMAIDGDWRVVDWPGVDAAGRPVPAGVYFAHIRQGRAAGAVKLTRLH